TGLTPGAAAGAAVTGVGPEGDVAEGVEMGAPHPVQNFPAPKGAPHLVQNPAMEFLLKGFLSWRT
ncbi:MAG: hypothetical protein DMG68_09340, partial [Acidobacteria bacterium]